MRKFLKVLILLVFVSGMWGMPARAQAEASLRLFNLQGGSFPNMTVQLDAFDANGSFLMDLTPEQITLLEDGQPRPVNSLRDVQPGVQFVLALDPGQAFAHRNSRLVTRFAAITQAIQNWAAAHPDDLGDDLNLLPTAGKPSSHLTETAVFADALAAYQPNLQELTFNLDTLAHALDVASEPSLRPDMKRAVLYVTSLPSADSIKTIQELTQRAVDLQIRVYVWVVVPPGYATQPAATAIKDLALLSGGQYFLFSGEEELPSLETYLAPLRHAYLLTYTSSVSSSGNHTLIAQVHYGSEEFNSPSLSFEVNVQPPSPILVSPPTKIIRQGADMRTANFSAFHPTEQTIQAIIEFPDGHPRPLIRTALYVDGVLVDENTTEPFDQFIWDLSAYEVSGEHHLQVTAMDSLGLQGVSLGLPVTVTVIQPERGLSSFLKYDQLWIVLGAVSLAGIVLGVTLIQGRKRRLKKVASRKSEKDPLTQPLPARAAKRRQPLSWLWPTRPSAAYLIRLKETGEPATAPPVPISSPEIIFGSDPIQATRVLDDPSVSPLHARIREEKNDFILIDEHSAAGTWVNYEPLTAPRRLQHGDLLHIGKIAYRFMLRKPPQQATPRLTPLEK